jgi:hypothetical protein
LEINKEISNTPKEIEKEINVKNNEIYDLKLINLNLENKYNSLIREEEESKSIIKKQNERINELRELNSNLSYKNNTLITKIKEIPNKNYDGKDDKFLISDLENDNMMFTLELENFKNQENILQNILQNNINENEKLNNDLNQMSQSLNLLKVNDKRDKDINKYELKEKENKINELNEQKDKLIIEIKKKEQSLALIERDLREQKIEISNINEEYEDQCEYYVNEIEKLKLNISKLENDLKNKKDYNKNKETNEILEFNDNLGELETIIFVDNNNLNEQIDIKQELNINLAKATLEEKRLIRDFENLKKGNFQQIQNDRLKDKNEDRKRIINELNQNK